MGTAVPASRLPTAERPSTAALGGAALWAGTIAVNASTAIVLAVLSRTGDAGHFSSASAIFGLVFVLAVVPAGLQLGAAAAATDGSGTPAFPMRIATAMAIGTALLTPVLALLLHTSYLALAGVAVMSWPLVGTAVRRGALIGAERFVAAGRSFAIEGAVRALICVLLGSLLGPTGVAWGLALAAAVAWLATPRLAAGGALVARPSTTLPHTVAAMALLAGAVNFDVIAAPGVLGPSAADRYDAVAVPAKAVFLALLAIGMLTFASARRTPHTRAFTVPVLATAAAGIVLAGLFVVARPIVAAVLGRPGLPADWAAVLGVAMGLAAATSVAVNLLVARGARWPWVPPAGALVVLLVAAGVRPSPTAFAGAMLAAQLLAFVSALVFERLENRGSGTRLRFAGAPVFPGVSS